ncbi:MAG TPA: ATP-binding protein [Nocardioidaceae bacterium]|nr:ATP-binding protein [Nocardioidaceae bacterium]
MAERPESHAPALRQRLQEQTRSVRTRITAWVILLTGLALLGVGFSVYLLESNRVDERITESINQEMREFEALRTAGIDPETGEPFRTARALIETALERNAPESHEILLGVFPRGEAQTTRELEALDGTDRAAILDAIDRQLPQGGFDRVRTSLGELVFAVKPVRSGSQQAGYVIGYFHDLEHADVLETMRTYSVVAALALLLVALGAWFTAGRLLSPVRHLRNAAREINDTDLSRRIDVDGNDDLSDLAHTFNSMLDRLEQSFSLQRGFLDDAGHELRTPITIVRGHLEVADTGNVADMEATRSLVLDELDRMGRLVDDLIVLAKSGQPDFVRTTDVDAAALTDHVLAKVRALGDRAWILDSRADAIADADPQRVTQALVQLAKNAVQHTHPGAEIAIGSAVRDGGVEWWVRDAGPGVQRADAERVFERFQRGHQARGHDGSGLGLSIVRAIAVAHGGEVHLRSDPGHGAVFTLVVPLAHPHHPEPS